EGEKIYHLNEPSVLAEDEVEPLCVRSTTDIRQVDLARVGIRAPNMCFGFCRVRACISPRTRRVGWKRSDRVQSPTHSSTRRARGACCCASGPSTPICGAFISVRRAEIG